LGCTYNIGIFGKVGDSYQILVSTATSFDFISDGITTVGYVAGNTLKYYQLYIGAASNLTISLEACRGQVDLYVDQNGQRPDKSHFVWSSALKNSIDTVSIQRYLSDASFYIGVYGQKDLKSSTFYLTATTRFTTRFNPIINVPSISVSATGGNQVTLTFMLADRGVDSRADTIHYNIYYARTDDQMAVLYSFCGVDQTTLASHLTYPVSSAGQLVSVVVDKLQSNTFYSFNILAYEPDSNLGRSLYSVQGPVQTLDSTPVVLPLKWILGIGIPAFFVLVGFVLYLYVKNRRLTKELSIEMHDVPKAAVRKALRGPQASATGQAKPNAQTQKYSQLLATDEDTGPTTTQTEEDPYAPPDYTNQL
jgi:hypothetical protein